MCLGPAPTGPNVGATGCYPADSQGWQMEAGIKHGQSETKITEQYGVHREDGGYNVRSNCRFTNIAGMYLGCA